MGSASAKLQIEFDPNPEIYYGGDRLKGVVRVTPDNIQLNGRELSIQVEARAIGTGKVQQRTLLGQAYTADGVVQHTIFKKRIILMEPPFGKNKFTLSKGQKVWPFDIELPRSAPPTLSTLPKLSANHPTVYITVEAQLKQSLSSLTDRKSIIFRPPVLMPPRISSSFLKINRQTIQVKVDLPQGSAYIPGEMITGIVEINNPQRIRIKRIECHIKQTVQVGDGIRTIDVFKVNLPKITDTNDIIQREAFDIQLPEDLPPTYEHIGDANSDNIIISVKYTITFLTRVIGILSDFELVEPLFIATNRQTQENSNEQVTSDEVNTTPINSES